MNTEQLKPSELKPWVNQYPEAFRPDIASADCSLNDALWLNNLENMYSTALYYCKRKISFKEMKDQIVCTARALIKIGVQQGDIIPICAAAIPEVICLIYAMDMIGAVPDIIAPETEPEALRAHLKEVKSKTVVVLDTIYADMQRAVAGTITGKVIVVSKKDSMRGFYKLRYGLRHKIQNQYEANAVMWLDFYYSGLDPLDVLSIPEYRTDRTGILYRTATGIEKINTVMLSQRAVNAAALQYGADHYARRERSLDLVGLDTVFGFVCAIHAPLICGASVILIPDPDEEDLGAFILKEKPDHVNGNAAYYNALCQSPKAQNADLSFLKSVVCSDHLTEGTEKQINGFLKSHESAFMLSKVCALAETASAAVIEKGYGYQQGALGYPLCDTDAGIFDPETEKELDFDEVGEICFSGPGLMQGYFGKPEATSAVLKRHQDGRLWLHSGMIGMMARDGYLTLSQGVQNPIVLYDGRKIDAAEIEKRLERHSNVMRCVVVGVSDRQHQKGEVPFAFIKWNDETTEARRKALREIRRYCEMQLSDDKRPVEFVSVRRLPQTEDGQIDYTELKKQGNAMNR